MQTEEPLRLQRLQLHLHHWGWGGGGGVEGAQQASWVIDADGGKSQTVLHTALHTLMCLIAQPILLEPVPDLHSVNQPAGGAIRHNYTQKIYADESV